ncbi:MAG: hypothetical protein ACJ8CR_08710 [Roseiflexaceae bacterium]
MSKQQKKNKHTPPKLAGGMALAAGWPVHEVLLSRGWEQEAALTTILVARRSPASGKVAAALFLVDLACLGVKSAQVKLFKDAAEYAAGLRAHAQRVQPMAPADFDLAAKIIFTGLEYAAGLGLKPDPVFAQAQHLLAGADPAACPTPVRTGGPEGKPFFVAGPYDDARRIVAQLLRTVGEGNFHYLVGGTAEELGLPENIVRRLEDAEQQAGR